MTSRATPAEIEEVNVRRLHCRQTWDADEFIEALHRLYGLLVTIGHWPENYIDYPPSAGWSDTDIDIDELVGQGVSQGAITMLRRLPYPNVEMRYHHSHLNIFGDTRLIDAREIDDLKQRTRLLGMSGKGDATLEGTIIPLMVEQNRNGDEVLLDVEDGTICQVEGMEPLRPHTVEYKVEQHLRGLDHFGSDLGAMYDYLTDGYYKFQPFTRATDYITALHERLSNLRLLPLLTSRWDADRDLDSESIPDTWRRDFLRRKQDALVTLYIDCKWPDIASFDRARAIDSWKLLEHSFNEEEMLYLRQLDPPNRQTTNGGTNDDENGDETETDGSEAGTSDDNESTEEN